MNQPDLATGNTSADLPPALSKVAIEAIDLFVRIANLFGISRSIGEIYGFLFITAEPAHFDVICKELNISNGSASHGLRFLRNVGAVHATYSAGDRRDHFVAEVRLRKIAAGFLRERIEPNLNSLDDRLDRLQGLLGEIPRNEGSALEDRIRILQNWRKQAQAVLPMVMGGLETDGEK